MIPIDTLIKPPTSDDIFNKAIALLETVGIPASSWRDGGVAKSLLSVLSNLAASGAAVISSVVAGFFLYYAAGDYLTAHANDVYDVQRIPATFASGQVTFTNVGGGVYTVGANEMIVNSSSTGARYRVTTGFTLPAATGTPPVPTTVTVSVTAISSGSASSVAPAEIDTLETTLRGVSVTNPASINGSDAEGDPALRKRCLVKKGTWSPFGPRDTYEFSALSATLLDGTPTTINRVAVSRFSSTGIVKVVCATPNGTPSSDELTAVTTLIESQSRPDSVTVQVSGAVQHVTTHNVILWSQGGVASSIIANANKALAAFYATYPIGGISKTDGGTGYLYLDAIAAVLINSSPTVFDAEFEFGAGDTPLAWNEVATNTTTLTVRIR